MEVLFFRKSQPDPLIVGASDIGHGYYGPETGDRVRESNPGPTKRSCCKARESNPGPTKKDCVQGQGFEPWTNLIRLCVRSCTRSLITIAHTIVKFQVRTKYAQVHERVPSGTCPLDDGQRPDRPKNGRRTDRFKNDETSEKIMFLAEHIFFKVPHHVPNYVHFYRLNQPSTIRM